MNDPQQKPGGPRARRRRRPLSPPPPGGGLPPIAPGPAGGAPSRAGGDSPRRVCLTAILAGGRGAGGGRFLPSPGGAAPVRGKAGCWVSQGHGGHPGAAPRMSKAASFNLVVVLNFGLFLADYWGKEKGVDCLERSTGA